MFIGEYAYALDSKGRLTIPAGYRPQLVAGLMVTRGYEPCLAIYPLAEWSVLANKAAQMPTASRAARSYSRLVFGGAFELVPDKMGRILIPGVLRDYAGIATEAIWVGVNTYVEVWAPDRRQQILERDTRELDVMLADVAHMGV
jgi:MraZ protein